MIRKNDIPGRAVEGTLYVRQRRDSLDRDLESLKLKGPPNELGELGFILDAQNAERSCLGVQWTMKERTDRDVKPYVGIGLSAPIERSNTQLVKDEHRTADTPTDIS